MYMTEFSRLFHNIPLPRRVGQSFRLKSMRHWSLKAYPVMGDGNDKGWKESILSLEIRMTRIKTKPTDQRSHAHGTDGLLSPYQSFVKHKKCIRLVVRLLSTLKEGHNSNGLIGPLKVVSVHQHAKTAIREIFHYQMQSGTETGQAFRSQELVPSWTRF